VQPAAAGSIAAAGSLSPQLSAGVLVGETGKALAGDRNSQQQLAALTTTPTASGASQEQAKAAAFIKQVQVYAQLSAAYRAEAAAVSAVIAGERAQVTVTSTAVAVTSAPGKAVSTVPPGSSSGVPAAASEFEAHRLAAAALGDKLRANAQRLANFHLTRASQLAGTVGTGGAQ